ncbi:MAG: CDP-glucose 4,6-dehydratase [Campylobacteraceae bacterium]
MQNLFGGIYKNKTVFITGHTGFKGSWLSFWLEKMGANVIGYSLNPPTTPNHINLLDLKMKQTIADIRDLDTLNNAIKTTKPDIVFHLAAQPLVRLSYKDPILTYSTNVMGTLNVLEACRKNGVKALVNITSDKAYENKEWIWGYRENDPLGGYDPYSSSKGCADILVNSYRNSYFNVDTYKKTHNTLIASCRAGNVIGGGDWAEDRLMTNLVLSASKNAKMQIRSPKATRPWQHVLEPLSGYLQIGQKLLEEDKNFSEAWNFGPSDDGSINVENVVKIAKSFWNKVDFEIKKDKNAPHEANLLKLDCSKAHIKLQWKSVWENNKTFEKTINWYKSFYEKNEILTCKDLDEYIKDAKDKNIKWSLL